VTERWLVSVDRSVCIGSGMCVGTAPDRFRLGDDQRSHPVDAEIDPDESVRDAASYCPTEAILLRDAATGAPIDVDA